MSASWRSPRVGLATVWVLVVMSVLTILSAGLTRQFVLARRLARDDVNQAQALWLARSGLDVAAARLLAAEDYQGETLHPLPETELVITVAKDADTAGRYHVTSQARLPGTGQLTASRTLEGTFQRREAEGATRLERLAE